MSGLGTDAKQTNSVRHRTVAVNGLDIFYREGRLTRQLWCSCIVSPRHHTKGVVAQNGNAYEVELGPNMQPARPYWADRVGMEDATGQRPDHARSALRLPIQRRSVPCLAGLDAREAAADAAAVGT